MIKNGKSDLLTDSHSSLAWWRNRYFQLFNDVRHTEIRTVQSTVPETLEFGIEMAIVKLKRHKSEGINQIPAELI